MTGENAAQQPRRGARITHVQHVRRFGQAPHTATRHAPGAVRVMGHLGAEGTHGGSGPQHVLTGEQA